MALQYPDDLLFTDSHEFVRLDGGVATIGVSAFAVDQLGDIVFLELPEVGATLTRGDSFGTVESVKAVSDLYAPLDGEVLERNEAALEAPELLNEDPYERGWLLKVKVTAGPEDLMETAVYRAQVEGQ
jgi:glycine cleavage system H protein